ncbi:MAG: class II aldolase/adducin family protein [Candidatus Marinimicrobia bacterium]|nr:class II aldolase/adducin family protein [Candidatus Neomarinimicrobiota bacterium]
MTDFELQELMITVGKRMYDKGFVSASDGNISVRVNDGIIITRSGVCKCDLTDRDLIKILNSNEIIGENKPSSELRMHVEIYKVRPDIKAIVHGHPPYATAFAVAGKALTEFVLPEIVLTLGKIPLVQYRTPGTQQFAESVAETLVTFDAALLENHGVVTGGNDLWDAYYKLERVEHAAKILTIANTIGKIRHLTDTEISELVQSVPNSPELERMIHH